MRGCVFPDPAGMRYLVDLGSQHRPRYQTVFDSGKYQERVTAFEATFVAATMEDAETGEA